ncbi:MAG TPA: protein kinase [Povalibacter sp.]|uniref:protein kinase domain-containing protein n=1 Tax=Povalibacter sp. TaxID=1962978 RepID=UPI002B792869|nr:protein kinase [Povalibacter sp.]HMN44960.1 protein kinase [Povalibacter sp.]
MVRALGSGGSGHVWLAQDNERKRLVAVKVLADELMQDVAAIAALHREASRLKTLEHPNILQVEGLYRSPRHAWIAMEYVSGGDLTSWRGRGCAEILRVTIPVAQALAHAHRSGFVHRDVKPANVLLTSDGIPKLTDFGIALALAEMPTANAGRGSPFSMSPQQMDGQPASASDDVYGFGALLYELLSGYPPFYPEATPEKVRDEAPKSLTSVPAAVAQLVDRCLAKSPGDRPADMDSIANELSAALAALPAVSIVNAPAARPAVTPPSIRPPVAQGEPLRSEWRRPDAASRSEDDLRRQGFRRGLGAAALVAGIVGVGIVFFALPRWFPTAEPAKAVTAAKPKEEEAPPAKKELDFATLARAKQQAEDLRAAIDPRLEKLRTRAVDQWGGAEFKQATDELAAGDKDFAAREYVTAGQHFSAIEPLLDVLEKRAGEVLARELSAGSKALAEGRSGDAKTAFELAAKVEPGNAAATRGLKRAGTLDEVLALVTTGERLEREGNAAGASEAFNKALKLDADAPRAADGLARVGARVAGDAFAGNMARGFSALSAGRHAEARSAFEAASRIRPGSPEVAQALKQIEQEENTRSIAAKLDAAREFEAKERWAEALKEYQSVAQLDSTVAFGNEGIARTQPRADLNEQLELYLTQPERLFSAPVRSAAHQTLERAQSIAAPGPALKQQIATLRDWLARSETPVQIAIQSDNLTQITIYRVGALGAFEQRSLELAPGSYTVVGTRPGYRDVRREINVTPGAALQPVVVRCEEKI